MRIVHVVLPGASAYEKKSQRIDFDCLRPDHEVVVLDRLPKAVNAGLAQVYGPPSRVGDIAVSPLRNLPEAVAEEYFSGGQAILPVRTGEIACPPQTHLGSFDRPSIRRIIEQTMPRLHRTRDDVEWLLFDRPPSPSDFAKVDAWIDPAVEDDDYDGFVAEALVSGKVVVASRTPINSQRLERGRSGLLVLPGDANELTHAILTALFKTEVAQQKTEAARQTNSKFRSRQRLRVLTHMLETVRP